MITRIVVCLCLVSCVQDQAPGDGDALCTEETIDGIPNEIFANHPVYSVRERPLMDSRDYISLISGGSGAHTPWQSVNRDINNVRGYATSVRGIAILYIMMFYKPSIALLVDTNRFINLSRNSDSVWIQ